jgi:hypothetical protein
MRGPRLRSAVSLHLCGRLSEASDRGK